MGLLRLAQITKISKGHALQSWAYVMCVLYTSMCYVRMGMYMTVPGAVRNELNVLSSLIPSSASSVPSDHHMPISSQVDAAVVQ